MFRTVQFPSDGWTIHGRLFLSPSQTDSQQTVLLLHGFPGNEQDVLGLGHTLSSRGLDVLTFNYRGTYQSEGIYGLHNTMADIHAAAAFLEQPEVLKEYRLSNKALILGGYSYGGGMSLIFAANHPAISRVFSIAGTDHGQFGRDYQTNQPFADMIDTIFESLRRPEGPVWFEGKSIIANELLPNLDVFDLLEQAPLLVNKDILIIGGWDDPNVTMENHILPLYRRLQALGSTRISIKGYQDGHEFTHSRRQLATDLADWILNAS